MKTKKLTIKQAINSSEVSFNSFYNALYEFGEGFWDGVNDTEIIKMYITDMINEDIWVSHILEAIETEHSSTDLWEIWLGDSGETPSPINTKKELVDALGLVGLNKKLEFDLD